MDERGAASQARPGGGVIGRAAMTGALVALVAVGTRITLPFVDVPTLRLVPGGMQSAAVLAVGLTPFLTAFLLVEVAALLLPGLRARRNGTYAERGGLTRAAWLVGLAFAALQAYGVVVFLRSGPGPFGAPLLDGGSLVGLAVGLTVVAGSAAAAWVATLISRRGFGNGFAVLAAALPVIEAARGLPARLLALLDRSSNPMLGYASEPRLTRLALLLTLVLVGVIVFFFSRALRAGAGRTPAVPAPTCGIMPIQWAPSLLLLIATLANYFPEVARHLPEALQPWVDDVHSGGVHYELLYAVLTLALVAGLARLFCSPAAVKAAWAAARLDGDGTVQEEKVRFALTVANVLSAILLLVIVVLPYLAMKRIPLNLRGLLLQLLVVTAVVLDVAADVRARLEGRELVAVYPLHRVYAVEPVLAALGQAGIAAHVRGRYFRALYHFFAPYVPIEVLVAPARAAEAEAICARIARAEPGGAA